ncbi:hypothetical protein [Chromobacterium sp. CV08]|uniref:hypothetical protein n=1 Tax=Chromobacterium sp. CV08 TaxID=3133274 RepID=UPI003DA7E711
MSLIASKTKWVLFLSSSSQAEERHIFDLAFGVHCLELAGILPVDIHIYIDGSNRNQISQCLSIGTNNNYTIKTTSDFFSDNKHNQYENLVLFITGHGGLNGIEASSPITPYMLLSCIKSTPNLNRAILYLGQCYAGTFNYINAGKKTILSHHSFPSSQPINDPEIIVVGATSLHESLSSSTNEKLSKGDLCWLANVFLLHVFKWISAPVDVDGDGKKTVIDSYKYAGALSNSKNKMLKVTFLGKAIMLHNLLFAANATYQANPTPQNQLNRDALLQQYNDAIDLIYVHQECWILNAIPAQSIVF